METIGAYEAKTHFSKLIERVIKGDRITITKHGIPVAILMPPSHLRVKEPKKVIAELRKFREKHTLDGLSLREMINEGRR